jgi:aspartyl-tRNA(Asn)/glutamyl-tRNA(Gln) amidotransferase subunit A
MNPPAANIFLKTYPALHNALPAGAGFKFSIKDLFDVAGDVTTAGSKVLLDAPPAKADAVAVARLKAAGGVAVGRTNMSEFAFSGVGFNPHYGTPQNPAAMAYKPYLARVTGGSSSGAAASVASKVDDVWMADIGLGSDTGGSLRIPAALCGLVGFKSTARLVPTTGAFPLSTTLDTVGAITRDVATAIKAHEILAARKVSIGSKPLADYRLAVVRQTFQDGMDDTVKAAYEDALQALLDKGLRPIEIDLPELLEIPSINATGGFSPIEAYRWHKDLIAARQADYDPRVAQRILLGKKATEADYQTLLAKRADWIARVSDRLQDFDAVISPTVPICAPTIASIESDDAEFFRVNALLLRNPSIVNLLDGCAIALPPYVMLWHAAMHDDAILSLAVHIEKALKDLKLPIW